jgi:hypothetical protein
MQTGKSHVAQHISVVSHKETLQAFWLTDDSRHDQTKSASHLPVLEEVFLPSPSDGVFKFS